MCLFVLTENHKHNYSSTKMRSLLSPRRFSSIFSSSLLNILRHQSSSAASPVVQDQSRLLHFPEAYAELGLDGSNFNNSSNASTSPSSLLFTSINTVGATVQHSARPPVKNANSVPGVRAWINNVPVEREALTQIEMMSSMSDIIKHPIAIMPDCHYGNGATVGTVLPLTKAVIPAAVGVDIGCGLLAVKTSLREADLPADKDALRVAVELAVPHGRTHNGDPRNDAGSWRGEVPKRVAQVWREQLEHDFNIICARRPGQFEKSNNIAHLGSLGTGNHFVELCVEDTLVEGEVANERGGSVWVVIHTGSRGVGNRIGGVFIDLAKKDCESIMSTLPNGDLAYFKEGTKHFDEYVAAVDWAQKFARLNREVMLENIVSSLRGCGYLPSFTLLEAAINCHHNYIERASVGGSEVILTRKGATSAKLGELGVIPGSMGAATYIVRGKGNEQSYCSCSHGAGRRYSRGEATRRFTKEDHENATEGIACRKDIGVLDETPSAYKPIDDVMAAQSDLVEIVAKLHQVVNVKG